MTRAGLVVVSAVVACGGRPTPVEPVVTAQPVVAAPLDPACIGPGEHVLGDGKLRCRELPLTIDFPPNTKLRREDSGNLTFIAASLDRGVLALFIEPRFDVVDDAAGLRARLEAAIRGIAADAVVVDATAPPQAGATLSTAISFTTPDGGVGLVHGYLAHNWFVAAIAGGRKTDTPARPDQPVGQAYLASLKLHPPSPAWSKAAVIEGVTLELPVSRWEGAPVETSGIERATKLYAVPAERVWIGVRDIEPSPGCALFDNLTEVDVPGAIQKLFGRPDVVARGGLANLGKVSMFGELETPGGLMSLYLVCTDPQVLLVTVTGKRTAAELRTMLDRVTSTLPRH